jgi:hypothetical protein
MLPITMVGAMGAWVFSLGVPFFAIIPAAILGGLLVVGGEDVMELTLQDGRLLKGPPNCSSNLADS